MIDRRKTCIQERILLSFLSHKDAKEDHVGSLGRGGRGRGGEGRWGERGRREGKGGRRRGSSGRGGKGRRREAGEEEVRGIEF